MALLNNEKDFLFDSLILSSEQRTEFNIKNKKSNNDQKMSNYMMTNFYSKESCGRTEFSRRRSIYSPKSIHSDHIRRYSYTSRKDVRSFSSVNNRQKSPNFKKRCAQSAKKNYLVNDLVTKIELSAKMIPIKENVMEDIIKTPRPSKSGHDLQLKHCVVEEEDESFSTSRAASRAGSRDLEASFAGPEAQSSCMVCYEKGSTMNFAKKLFAKKVEKIGEYIAPSNSSEANTDNLSEDFTAQGATHAAEKPDEGDQSCPENKVPLHSERTIQMDSEEGSDDGRSKKTQKAERGYSSNQELPKLLLRINQLEETLRGMALLQQKNERYYTRKEEMAKTEQAKLYSQKEKLKQVVGSLKRQVAMLTNRAKILEQENKFLKESKGNLDSQIQLLKTEVKKRSMSAASSKQLSSSRQLCKRLSEFRLQFEKHKAKLSSSAESALASKGQDVLKEKIKELEGLIDSKNQKIAILVETVDDLRIELEKSKKERVRVEKELRTTIKEDKEFQEAKYVELSGLYSELKKGYDKCKKKLRKKSKAFREAMRAFERFTKESISLEFDPKRLMTSLDSD